MLRAAIQNGAATNRMLDDVGADVDEFDGLCTGSHHSQLPVGRIDVHEISGGTKRTAACVDR